MRESTGNKQLKRTTARTSHTCYSCGARINSGEYYYRDVVEGRPFDTFHANKFCQACYEKYGENLLTFKRKK